MVKKDYKKLKDLNKNLADFLIHAITTHTIKETGQAIFTNIKGWDKLNQGDGMKIKFSIDGVELDFIHCWKDYENAWDRGVMKQAKKMITDKMYDTFDGIRTKANVLEKYIKSKINELFPDLEDEDGY